ncbi:hypothetical protein AYI70_g3618 [Smittium culicis]|uniref:Uncharacterized protein n=1 Tax=Smittium culicis TaxID=133412 RepID=A0A1R1Y2W7_9FUNG|nr:hypothetical protein AYI70_g3618 [Smittium culicis]
MDIFDLYSSAFGGLVDDGDDFSSSEGVILGKSESLRRREYSDLSDAENEQGFIFDSSEYKDDEYKDIEDILDHFLNK